MMTASRERTGPPPRYSTSSGLQRSAGIPCGPSWPIWTGRRGSSCFTASGIHAT